MRCAVCGQDNPESARFCNACGSPLSGLPGDRLHSLRAFIPATVAEKIMAAGGIGDRRVVTVLFCDIVGSTPLAERLGPERFKVAMDQVLGRLITAVARYEGTVAQVMGDGLLAFFGAPLAHEDDPERAARAALDIQDAVATFGRDLEAAYGLSLRVRVGLNTGLVVLSRITDVLEVAYNALGDTVTTAARLQGAAAPGAILASGATARLVETLFDQRAVGPLHLKGKEAPVEAVEIVAARAIARKERGVRGVTSPLVGRERELDQLQQSIDALLEGRGQIVALIGEAGMGKSRLVAEVQRTKPQVRWLEGRCLSYAGAIPYFPFQDLLREWLGVSATDPDVKIRIELRAALDRMFGGRTDEVYPYLGTLLRLPLEPDAAVRLANLSAESLQHQTFNVMREWVAALAGRQPLAFVLDDLHWADATSLALLETLLEVTEQAPVLLCTLFRPEREHGCWRLNDLARQRFPHRHTEIILPPLSPAETDALVGGLLALPDVPEQTRRAIQEKAEGNPFFVEEVIRGLTETGALIREGERWRIARPITSVDVPESVQGVLLARIDRLPEEARRLLQAASVVGRLFSPDILRTILRQDGALDAALVDLQRHDLIVERRRFPQAEYRFKHHLTQEVAYGTLTEAERRRLHRKVARALEQQYAGRAEEIYGMLAYHYDQAAEEEMALHFLVRAGDKARAEYADVEALRHYARAVDLMKRRGDWSDAAQTLMKAALAHHIAFDFRAADKAYREAFILLEGTAPLRLAGPAATLRVATTEPISLDTTQGFDSASGLVGGQVFEGLLRFAPDLSVGPAAARSWEVSPDGTRYRLHLHRDRRWSDGRPVTAHDFVFSWLRAMRGVASHLFHDIRGAKRYGTGEIDDPQTVGVRALDDHTLEVRLEGPRAYFPFILAHPNTVPNPRWIIERYGDEWTAPPHIVGNGPFVVAEWVRGKQMRLTRNPAYTGAYTGNVAEAHLVFAGASDPRLFEEGQVDVQILIGSIRSDLAAARLAGYAYLDAPQTSVYFFFGCNRPPFDDQRLRRAFAHATDYQALLAGAANTLPALGGCVPPALPGHTPNIELSFDPDLARRLMHEAGYLNGRALGPFTMTVPEGWAFDFESLKRAWREILGVEVGIIPVTYAEHFTLILHSPPPVGIGGWAADYPDPDSFLRVAFHSTSAGNYGRWRNPRFDALVEEAQRVTDHRKRMALYHEADRLLVAEEVAIVPVAYWRGTTLAQPYVRRWWPSFIGVNSFADLSVEREGADGAAPSG